MRDHRQGEGDGDDPHPIGNSQLLGIALFVAHSVASLRGDKERPSGPMAEPKAHLNSGRAIAPKGDAHVCAALDFWKFGGANLLDWLPAGEKHFGPEYVVPAQGGVWNVQRLGASGQQ